MYIQYCNIINFDITYNNRLLCVGTIIAVLLSKQKNKYLKNRKARRIEEDQRNKCERRIFINEVIKGRRNEKIIFSDKYVYFDDDSIYYDSRCR